MVMTMVWGKTMTMFPEKRTVMEFVSIELVSRLYTAPPARFCSTAIRWRLR
jgi:hypothetical protein